MYIWFSSCWLNTWGNQCSDAPSLISASVRYSSSRITNIQLGEILGSGLDRESYTPVTAPTEGVANKAAVAARLWATPTDSSANLLSNFWSPFCPWSCATVFRLFSLILQSAIGYAFDGFVSSSAKAYGPPCTGDELIDEFQFLLVGRFSISCLFLAE